MRWWPVAFALQRLEDKRALPALLTLAKEANPYTRAFAVKGLAALKDRVGAAGADAADVERRAQRADRDRACARPHRRSIGGSTAAARSSATRRRIRRCASKRSTRSARSPAEVGDALLDVLADPSPAIRAAALRSLAAFDRESFVTVLSGLDLDPHWNVRAALATVLGTLPLENAESRLQALLNDADQRVVPFAIAALVKLKVPGAPAVLLERLKAEDAVVRAAAAEGLGELKPANGAAALEEAYRFGQRDAAYGARAAALEAIAKYGAAAATPVLRSALADKDWAVRVRAAMLLKGLDPAGGAGVDAQIRPAPTTLAPDAYATVTHRQSAILNARVPRHRPRHDSDRAGGARRAADDREFHHARAQGLLQRAQRPPRRSRLRRPGRRSARRWRRRARLFDPRRAERASVPARHGRHGARPWPDTGGSQYFITHSPQPHLDARYTVFGRVIAGMDVVDKIQQWDVIRAGPRLGRRRR